MSDNGATDFEDIPLSDYPVTGTTGDMVADDIDITVQAIQDAFGGDGENNGNVAAGAEDIDSADDNAPAGNPEVDENATNQGGQPNSTADANLPNNNAEPGGAENNLPAADGPQGEQAGAQEGDNQGDQLNAPAGAPLNNTNDLEVGHGARNVAHAWPQPGRGMKYFLHANILCMVFSIVVVYLSDPQYNADLAKNKSNGLFLGLPERALRALNWSMIAFWAACFVVHAFRGEWSNLEHFKKQCLRLICLGLGVAALFLKWIEPEHVNLSYAPGVVTIAVEITYLGIDVITDAVCFFFETAVPWLATIGKPVVSFTAALVMVIVVWALYRGQK
ncbi:uncharacterized protein LY89DRAFT_686423 [Mollisia scopiformis]|uniref:Uncharacterized protein n=1 Tax=Mollisia scopiformis TaxID=149040 RepID=A0A194X3J0_MOLSC|nr:uncharacterized protein LY89DRAFT_686423 [Mollisia scopiformis]KUJ14765.1 hypothetical protein LY89DRAFT_686423 [Mollisia scopiformis]